MRLRAGCCASAFLHLAVIKMMLARCTLKLMIRLSMLFVIAASTSEVFHVAADDFAFEDEPITADGEAAHIPGRATTAVEGHLKSQGLLVASASVFSFCKYVTLRKGVHIKISNSSSIGLLPE